MCVRTVRVPEAMFALGMEIEVMHSTNSPLSAAAERKMQKSIFRAEIDIFVSL